MVWVDPCQILILFHARKIKSKLALLDYQFNLNFTILNIYICPEISQHFCIKALKYLVNSFYF